MLQKESEGIEISLGGGIVDSYRHVVPKSNLEPDMPVAQGDEVGNITLAYIVPEHPYDPHLHWAADTWAPGIIRILAGTGAPQARRITTNNATTITVSVNWTTVPDATSQYEVINTSTWTQFNDVASDNHSSDGTTSITWNLQ